jgi:malonyl-CoA/methylmalonyl-CoA synthetase
MNTTAAPILLVIYPQEGDVSVLMAVPTMYNYLLSHYESHMSSEEQQAARAAAAALRLTVSGSAAAPVPLLQRWQGLAGQRLLERYGMTETGMILSNPYEVGAAQMPHNSLDQN